MQKLIFVYFYSKSGLCSRTKNGIHYKSPSLRTSFPSQLLPPAKKHSMQIKIKSLIGVEKTLTLSNLSTVKDLKARIEMLETIPPEQQRLIYSGKILTDDCKMLGDYNVGEGSVVQMVLALRGG